MTGIEWHLDGINEIKKYDVAFIIQNAIYFVPSHMITETGEFPLQRCVTRIFVVFFFLRLKKIV